MITKEQYLLTCLMEECAEVAQRASKAIRFGIDGIQPGQDQSNRHRLTSEITDLFGVLKYLDNLGLLSVDDYMDPVKLKLKVEKISTYLTYAQGLKTVDGGF